MAEHIASVMQTDVPLLRADMPIRQAVAALVGGGLSAAPVIDTDGTLIGILTQKDCFRPALHAAYYQQWDGTVEGYMTKEVRTLEADCDLTEAAEAFLATAHRAYPVMKNDRFAGMLDRADLLRAMLDIG